MESTQNDAAAGMEMVSGRRLSVSRRVVDDSEVFDEEEVG